MDPLMEVRSAGSAEEALSIMNKREWLPDLALLDMMMPDMNGYELATAMRGVDHMAGISIIFVSANDRPADLAQYRSVGAIGFIRKPFDPLNMAKHVRDHLTGAVNSLAE
jgi:two-component system OmpR family response regulator